jgi:hypothetical protein
VACNGHPCSFYEHHMRRSGGGERKGEIVQYVKGRECCSTWQKEAPKPFFSALPATLVAISPPSKLKGKIHLFPLPAIVLIDELILEMVSLLILSKRPCFLNGALMDSFSNQIGFELADSHEKRAQQLRLIY